MLTQGWEFDLSNHWAHRRRRQIQGEPNIRDNKYRMYPKTRGSDTQQ